MEPSSWRVRRVFKNGNYHKIAALVIATAYFILLIFINNTSYVWATLAFVFVLFVTTFTCAKTDSPLLIQLRNSRLQDLESNNNNSNEVALARGSDDAQDTRIWMTDVPPSYALVMELGPPTPPPSYGSAILMFPPPYTSAKNTPQPQVRSARRPPLSISTQVSVCNSQPGTPQPRETRFTFSTQISLVDSASGARSNNARDDDVFTETLQLRTRLFLSRQASREDIADNDEPENSNEDGKNVTSYFSKANEDDKNSFPLQLRARLYLTRQASTLDLGTPTTSRISQHQHADGTRSNCHTPLTLKHAPFFPEPMQLRTKLFLSRQASREDIVDGEEPTQPSFQTTSDIPFVLAFKNDCYEDEEGRTACDIPVTISREEFPDGEEIQTTCEIPVRLLNQETTDEPQSDSCTDKETEETNSKKRK